MKRFPSVVGHRSTLGARGPRKALLGSAVVCLHLGLFWVLTRADHPTAPAAPQRVRLQLLPWVEQPVPASSRSEPAPTTTSSVPRHTRRAPAAGPPPSRAPARDDVNPTLEPHAISSATAAASAASQAERPLDLSLPRAFTFRDGAAHPAGDDPRAHSARPTPEARMTQTLRNRTGNSEEALADGTRRIRRGGDCVLVHPSQTAQLFPFNDSAQRTPKPVEPCD